MSAKQIAEDLMAKGYRRTSNKFCHLSRVDREDWKEHMAQNHAPWDIQEGRDWVKAVGPGANDFYRRVISNDTITVPREVSRHVKTSGFDPVGFIEGVK